MKKTILLRDLNENEKYQIRDIVENYGTPLYIYFYDRIDDQIKILTSSIKKFSQILKIKIYFALLANQNPYILLEIMQNFEKYGLEPGVFCASRGHLYILSYLLDYIGSFENLSVTYSDVYLTEDNIDYLCSINASSFYIILQSLNHFKIIKQYLSKKSKNEIKGKINLGIRIKLNFDKKTGEDIYSIYHGKNARFGLTKDDLGIVLYEIEDLGIKEVGFSIYPGTNIQSLKKLESIYQEFFNFVEENIRNFSFKVSFLDIGGGFGINYRKREILNLESIFETIVKLFNRTFYKLTPKIENNIFLEPGRFIVAPAGILVSKVIDIKVEKDLKFVIVDAGLSHFARPYIYNQYHKIDFIHFKNNKKTKMWKNVFVVGCTAASGDFFSDNPLGKPTLQIEEVEIGDLILFYDVGAYGHCMSSNFCGLLTPPEILVKNGKHYLIREGEKFENLIYGVSPCLKLH